MHQKLGVKTTYPSSPNPHPYFTSPSVLLPLNYHESFYSLSVAITNISSAVHLWLLKAEKTYSVQYSTSFFLKKKNHILALEAVNWLEFLTPDYVKNRDISRSGFLPVLILSLNRTTAKPAEPCLNSDTDEVADIWIFFLGAESCGHYGHWWLREAAGAEAEYMQMWPCPY